LKEYCSNLKKDKNLICSDSVIVHTIDEQRSFEKTRYFLLYPLQRRRETAFRIKDKTKVFVFVLSLIIVSQCSSNFKLLHRKSN
jgi:hypothetical protein